MSNYIVITTVFEPTDAVKKFSQIKDYKLVVVGDKKSPLRWECSNTIYISVEDQMSKSYELTKFLPYNHYSRKMIGYLEAIRMGATTIIDTDDDNIPKEDFGFPHFNGYYQTISKELGFVNVYKLFSDQFIWPRGFPLNLIKNSFNLENFYPIRNVKIGVWQGLADNDPDVDAIYRFLYDDECIFKERNPIVLEHGTIMPFNSQNTSFRKELFVLLYLPTYVTFRFTDILRGLIAQPIMWLYDYKLGFTKATVTQLRNPHNYMKDFISEIPMYMNAEYILEIVRANVSKDYTITENLLLAYRALEQEGIVESRELVTLNAWLKDLSHLSRLNNKN